jgi:arylsulfatase A
MNGKCLSNPATYLRGYSRVPKIRTLLPVLALAGISFLSCGRRETGTRPAEKPNFIILFCDDLGYGDIGCFGSVLHRTPNIDKIAREGMMLTSFYSSSGVCTPSRASLMTGCYPRRVNMHVNAWEGHMRQVLFPVARRGLNPDEITIAELLKERGYATECIGKWHLGDQPPFLPVRQGFDSYYGIPYSNDMGTEQFDQNPPLPLLRDEKVIEAPADQNTLTMRYTQEAVDFITANKDRPFFLYLPHTMPHNPVHASEAFTGKSANGLYGDAVEEIDWSTGRIDEVLAELGLKDKTLIVFTSDNGASSAFGGSNGKLRGWKGSVWEGGMRVPCVIRWPGIVPAGSRSDAITCTMDLLPTLVELAGGEVPADRIIDGENILPVLKGGRINAAGSAEEGSAPEKSAGKGPRVYYYYQKGQLQAVREGDWKLHLPLENKILYAWRDTTASFAGELYNLREDVTEQDNRFAEHPAIVARLLEIAELANADLGDESREGKNQRQAGFIKDPKPLLMENIP